MGRLDGKVALITGAAHGMGRASAAAFAAEGARLVLTDVSATDIEPLMQQLGGSATFLEHDVTNEQGWSNAIALAEERFGPLDILVNNAGVFQGDGLLETSLESYERVIGINQTGVFLGMRAAARAMVDKGRGGSIVNVSSVAGLRGGETMFAYAASKWAVRGMSRSGAKDLARHNIRVNCVHPGTIATAMLAGMPEETVARIASRVPMGRTGTPMEAANAILFLASDESSYMTGAELAVDGGIAS